MAWFGEGLSSLKGQLHNFTKEVLSEGNDDSEGNKEVLEDKIQELELVCERQKQEIESLKKYIEDHHRRVLPQEGTTPGLDKCVQCEEQDLGFTTTDTNNDLPNSDTFAPGAMGADQVSQERLLYQEKVLELQQQRLFEVEADREKVESRNQELEDEIARLREVQQQLGQELRGAAHFKTDWEVATARVQELEKDVEDLQQQLQDAVSLSLEGETVVAVGEVNQIISPLEDPVIHDSGSVKNECERCKAAHNLDATATEVCTRKEVEAATLKIAELHEQLAAVKEVNVDLNVTIGQLKSRCEEQEKRGYLIDAFQEVKKVNTQSTQTEAIQDEVLCLKKQILDQTAMIDQLQQLAQGVESQLVQALYEREQERISLNELTEGIRSKEREANGCKELAMKLEEKCALMTESLKQKDSRLKELESELQERLVHLEKLQQHLVSFEETYTQETLKSEERLKETQMKLMHAEQMLKDSRSSYTSVSVLANQQVETLKNQMEFTIQERNELHAKFAATEDELAKEKAAVKNLEMVLAQFIKGRDQEVATALSSAKERLKAEQEKQENLVTEVAHLENQLKEAQEGLRAASRLGEQLEARDVIIAELREKVDQAYKELEKAERKLMKHFSTEEILDKTLVKNLLIGYFVAPHSHQNEALQVLCTILDMNSEEKKKIGLQSHSGGWFAPAGPSENESGETLTQAFIRFLERESAPPLRLHLLPDRQATDRRPSSAGSEANSTPQLLYNTPGSYPRLLKPGSGTQTPLLQHLPLSVESGNVSKDPD